MTSLGQSRLLACAGLVIALVLQCACDRAPETAASSRLPAEQALPPAIISPADVPESAEPPSYEVAIATAAANHNRAKEKCAEKSERLRALCDAEADAAFADAEAGLADLRGNQQ